MIVKDSQSYRLLAITLMSGEISDDAAAMILSTDQYKKVIYKLISDKLLKRFQRDDLKGYRLTKQAKEILLAMDEERFAFFAADGADFSMRKTAARYRRRQHRIAEVLAMMERAQIECYRDKKTLFFERDMENQSKPMQSMFFHPKEVKAQNDLTRKIVNSKMTGIWVMENGIWLCYNMSDELQNWYENVENRANILIRSMFRNMDYLQQNTNALLFGRSMKEAKKMLEDPKHLGYIINGSFDRFCFIPLDDKGIILLEMLKDCDTYEHLCSILMEDLKEKDLSVHYIHDGYNAENQPVLIWLDSDLKRLCQFQMQLSYANKTGEIICFDFQKEAILEYCGKETKISEVDFETVKQNFFCG